MGDLPTKTEKKLKRSFSIWRVLAATGVIVVIGGAVGWHQGWFELPRVRPPANSIMVLMPYKYAGTWVFDDPSVGLTREGFVAGMPEMIDELVKDIPEAEKGFRLLFSARPFPGYAHKLVWRRGDRDGNWYYSEEYDKEGWLCPSLFKYYSEAPREIYVKAEKK